MRREFTGKDMAAILIAGFGIVIAVNFYMASVAINGFGGVVVENSYVASQKYNGWLEQAREAEALGYSATVKRGSMGQLIVTTESVPHSAVVTAELRRPLGKPEHQSLSFAMDEPGRFISTGTVPAGRWIVRLTIENDGQSWIDESQVQ